MEEQRKKKKEKNNERFMEMRCENVLETSRE
jgi:ribosomal protein S27E